MVSSRLLPRGAQVATPEAFAHAGGCSNLAPAGSRWVAGWVAGWVEVISLIYGVERLIGSRCSTFFNKLCAKKKRKGKERIRVTIGVSCYTCYPGMQANPPNVGGDS
jgi:hypothetical protein